jgi:hypothetical protein
MPWESSGGFDYWHGDNHGAMMQVLAGLAGQGLWVSVDVEFADIPGGAAAVQQQRRSRVPAQLANLGTTEESDEDEEPEEGFAEPAVMRWFSNGGISAERLLEYVRNAGGPSAYFEGKAADEGIEALDPAYFVLYAVEPPSRGR